MIEILPQSTGNVVAIRVNGKLVHEDYQQFIPKLEAIIKQYGSLRCYCEMTNFEGISWQAMMDEMRFDVKHCNQIERCAIVGNSSWNQWMAKFSKLIFHSAQIESFTPDQTEEAWNWTIQDSACVGATCDANQSTVGNTYDNTTSNDNTFGNPTGTNDNTYNNTPGTSNTPSGQTN